MHKKMFLFLFSSSFKDSAEEIVPIAWRYTLDPTRIFLGNKWTATNQLTAKSSDM